MFLFLLSGTSGSATKNVQKRVTLVRTVTNMAAAPAAPAAPDTAAAAGDDLFKDMSDKDDIARSLAAYKGYLTRTFKEVDRYKTAVTANPDEMAVTELQAAHSRLLHYARIVEAGTLNDGQE